MAAIRKKGKRWEAAIFRQGVRMSRTFVTKSEASFWAAEIEQKISAGKYNPASDKSFADLLIRYGAEVSPSKRGHDWELKRIAAFCKDEVSTVMLTDLRQSDFAAWRDRRLATVAAGTVLREMNLLSHALNTAVKDWGWLQDNPLRGVRRPPEPRPRDRLISDQEIQKLLFALGYDYDLPPSNVSARVGATILFAIETAMRAGEIAKLNWDCVDIDRRTARLLETKNGGKRDVPLSSEAVRILQQVKCGDESVFCLEARQIDALFRKAKSRTMISDLHFHDTRHLAITRLAGKLKDVLELARMVGHKDIRQLMIYFNPTAEQIAKKLDD